jgi:hypothetical protein
MTAFLCPRETKAALKKGCVEEIIPPPHPCLVVDKLLLL